MATPRTPSPEHEFKHEVADIEAMHLNELVQAEWWRINRTAAAASRYAAALLASRRDISAVSR